MRDTLAALEAKEPKSHALGYHFTDLDSARLILGSIGIRAANVGQLGGGVSISLASPVDMGWGGDDFEKTVGERLWGSKWYEVMLGMPWADLKQKIKAKAVKGSWPAARDHWGSWKKKLECVFVVRIPSEENRDPRRMVPGRDDVYILPKTDCVPDENGEYFFYPNENIVACLILKPPDDRDGCDAEDEKDAEAVAEAAKEEALSDMELSLLEGSAGPR